MARMAIDDAFIRDPRVIRLSRRLNQSRFEVMGRLLAVYAVVYDRVSEVIPADDIDTAAELEGFSEHMIGVDLAAQDRRGVLIKGARKRIRYLETREESGRAGGVKSGETRRQRAKPKAKVQTKVTFAETEGPVNPPDLVPDPDLDLDRDRDRDRDPDSRPSDSLSPTPVSPAVTRKPKSSESEIAAATRVLEALTERNEIPYTSPDHVKLVVERLRDGVDEFELRAVIAYCADNLRWAVDEKMRGNLQPHTLFHASKIAKYLDAARAEYAVEIARHRAERRDAA